MNGLLINKFFIFFKKISNLIKNEKIKKNFLQRSFKFIKNEKNLYFFIKNNINKIMEKKINLLNNNIYSDFFLKKIFKKNIFNIYKNKLIFINGNFFKEFSNFKNCEINEFIDININNVINDQKLIENNELFFKILQNIFYKKYIINFKKNIINNDILHILNININDKNNNNINISNLYNTINILENTEVKIIETYYYINNNINFHISNRNINLYNNSKLDYIVIYDDLINYNYYFTNNIINLKKNSLLNNNLFIINSGNVNHNNYINFNNNNSKCNINSFSYSKKNYHFIKSYINHNFNNCESYQLHKLISEYNGYNDFKGFIKIKKNVKNITGDIFINGLITNKKSKISIDPKLKIDSEDVIFKHGISLSNINYDYFFYFQSRCISYKNSFNIIILSFIYDIIYKIKNKCIKKYIYNKILNKINKK